MSGPLAVCDLAGDEAVGEKDGLVLFLLAPCELMTTQGVVFWELAQGMDKEAIRRLNYPVTKDVEKYLCFCVLEMFALNPDLLCRTAADSARKSRCNGMC